MNPHEMAIELIAGASVDIPSEAVSNSDQENQQSDPAASSGETGEATGANDSD